MKLFKLWFISLFLAVPAMSQSTSTLSDVYTLGSFSPTIQYGVTNNYNIGACVERELHDGQWLAGGCKDILYITRLNSSNVWTKAFHLGGAYMANAQHGNQSYQLKAGFNLGALGALGASALSLAAPAVSDIKLPPWTQYIGNAITLDFAGGYRPIHDSSVNGNWTYGIMASVNVPIQTTFEWLISGL